MTTRSDQSTWPLVSVIIPARNEEKTIEQCVRSVLEQDYPRDRIEVLVVDGRSTDGTREIVERIAGTDSRLRLLDNPLQITPVARNIGVQASRGEIVAIVDGHCWLERDFVRKGVEALRSSRADCVGGLLINVARSNTGRAIALVMNSSLGVGNSASRALRRAKYVDHVSFPLYPRSIFSRVGYFDPAMIKNQDDEFNYRLRASGGKIYFSPEIRAYYWVRESLSALWRQYFLYGRYKIEVLRRYPKQMQFRQFLPPALVSGIVATVCTAFIWKPAILATIVASVCYGGYVALGTMAVAKRESLQVGMRVPLVFVTLHWAYGAGFVAGIVGMIRRKIAALWR